MAASEQDIVKARELAPLYQTLFTEVREAYATFGGVLPGTSPIGGYHRGTDTVPNSLRLLNYFMTDAEPNFDEVQRLFGTTIDQAEYESYLAASVDARAAAQAILPQLRDTQQREEGSQNEAELAVLVFGVHAVNHLDDADQGVINDTFDRAVLHSIDILDGQNGDMHDAYRDTVLPELRTPDEPGPAAVEVSTHPVAVAATAYAEALAEYRVLYNQLPGGVAADFDAYLRNEGPRPASLPGELVSALEDANEALQGYTDALTEAGVDNATVRARSIQSISAAVLAEVGQRDVAVDIDEGTIVRNALNVEGLPDDFDTQVLATTDTSEEVEATGVDAEAVAAMGVLQEYGAAYNRYITAVMIETRNPALGGALNATQLHAIVTDLADNGDAAVTPDELALAIQAAGIDPVPEEIDLNNERTREVFEGLIENRGRARAVVYENDGANLYAANGSRGNFDARLRAEGIALGGTFPDIEEGINARLASGTTVDVEGVVNGAVRENAPGLYNAVNAQSASADGEQPVVQHGEGGTSGPGERWMAARATRGTAVQGQGNYELRRVEIAAGNTVEIEEGLTLIDIAESQLAANDGALRAAMVTAGIEDEEQQRWAMAAMIARRSEPAITNINVIGAGTDLAVISAADVAANAATVGAAVGEGMSPGAYQRRVAELVSSDEFALRAPGAAPTRETENVEETATGTATADQIKEIQALTGLLTGQALPINGTYDQATHDRVQSLATAIGDGFAAPAVAGTSFTGDATEIVGALRDEVGEALRDPQRKAQLTAYLGQMATGGIDASEQRVLESIFASVTGVNGTLSHNGNVADDSKIGLIVGALRTAGVQGLENIEDGGIDASEALRIANILVERGGDIGRS